MVGTLTAEAVSLTRRKTRMLPAPLRSRFCLRAFPEPVWPILRPFRLSPPGVALIQLLRLCLNRWNTQSKRREALRPRPGKSPSDSPQKRLLPGGRFRPVPAAEAEGGGDRQRRRAIPGKKHRIRVERLEFATRPDPARRRAFVGGAMRTTLGVSPAERRFASPSLPQSGSRGETDV